MKWVTSRSASLVSFSSMFILFSISVIVRRRVHWYQVHAAQVILDTLIPSLGQRPANRPQSRAEFSANSWECRTCNEEEGTWDWTARFHHVRTVALHQPRPLCCRWTCRNTWGCRAMGRTIPHKFIELPTRSPDAGPYKIRLSLFDQTVSTAAPSTLILLLSAARRGVPAEPSTAGFSAAAPAASCTHGIGIGCSYP